MFSISPAVSPSQRPKIDFPQVIFEDDFKIGCHDLGRFSRAREGTRHHPVHAGNLDLPRRSLHLGAASFGELHVVTPVVADARFTGGLAVAKQD